MRHPEDIRSRIERIIRDKEQNKLDAVKGLVNLLIDMLYGAFEKGTTIWILIDRLDECDLHLRRIMDQLTRLMAVQRPTLKIFVTANAYYEGVDWDANDISRDIRHRVFFHELDQRRKHPFAERFST
jgi:hypothetical protein